eukprot:13452506-Alexandrium_andersonii.AAC.1
MRDRGARLLIGAVVSASVDERHQPRHAESDPIVEPGECVGGVVAEGLQAAAYARPAQRAPRDAGEPQ